MRHRFLTKLAELIYYRTWTIGFIVLGITTIFIVMTMQLSISTSMTSLMPEDDPMVIEFDKIMEEYAGAASMLIVAEGDPDRLVEFADAVVPRVEAMDHWVKKVDYKLPKDLLENHALMLMKASDLENTGALFKNPNLVPFLTNLNDSFEREYIKSDEKISGQEQEQGAIRFMDGIQTFVETFDEVLDGQVSEAGRVASDAILMGDVYYRSWDRTMMIMQIIPVFSFLDVQDAYDATNAIEPIVWEVAREFEVQAGLTGIIPLSRDEMRAIQNDSMIITTLALLGILILFIVAFRMIVSPILAIITLMVGIVWALGISWLLVGELNMMTAMMGVILVGIGIDFSIHIISTYTEMRAKGEEVGDALKITLQKSGMGIITGGLTTSAAFLTFLISETQGYREFGLTLGVGIIMTMLASITVLPTMLVIREKILTNIWKKRKEIAPRDISYRFLGTMADWLARHSGAGIALVIMIILFLGYRGSQITMDYNYLNMEPEGLESIELQERMIEVFDISTDYAYLTASTLDEAHKLTEAARDMSTSGLVQSIVDFLPSREEQKKRQHYVEMIHKTMDEAPVDSYFDEGDYRSLLEQINRLEMNVMEMQDMAILGGQDKVYLKTALLVGVVLEEEDQTIIELQTILRGKMNDISRGMLTRLRERLEMDGYGSMANLKQFHHDFASAFKPAVLKMANSEVITLETLPENIKNQYVGKSGDSFLISVFPKQNVWEQTFLERFVDELLEVSPRATGIPPVWRSLLDLFARDGKLATSLAIVVIFLLLLADFRSLQKAALGMIPLVIGTAWMLGVMELTGLQITMLNVMAIPLIIGIGIDDGVHIIHRYQIEGGEAHRIVFASTGRAILLTSLTTMLGFGSLWFATYRGLGSMGIALFIGVGACFVATVLVIPTLVGFAHSFRK